MKRLLRQRALIATALAARLATAAELPESTPVLDDAFSDGGCTNGADPLDTSWLAGQANLPRLEILRQPPPAGPVLRVVSGKRAWGKLAAPLGASFGLHGPGTYVRLSFSFRLADTAALEPLRGQPGRGLFRFGLCQGNGALQAPGWSGRDGETDGFGGSLGFAPPGGDGRAEAGVFVEDNQAAGVHSVLGGPAPEGLVVLKAGKDGPGISDDRPHRVELLLRQDGADTATLRLSLDGRALAEAGGVDLRGRPRAFDTVVFSTATLPLDFELDDVRVEVVPD